MDTYALGSYNPLLYIFNETCQIINELLLNLNHEKNKSIMFGT